MNYFELHFILGAAEDYQKDLLINALGEAGFDTFEEVEDGFKAYIPAEGFQQDGLDEQLLPFKGMFPFTYSLNFVPQQNWNEVWESNFKPISVAGQVYVRATFHQPQPEFRHEIMIDPKMAFGTGHHQTTALMMELMLGTEFTGKKVLDMGCGTGILAILAEKLDAAEVTAIDYDPVCYESAIENADLNQTCRITALCGSKEAIPNTQFDIILANINRNILLDQLPVYASKLKPEGVLFLSGFYQTPDLGIIASAALEQGLGLAGYRTQNDWAAAKFAR